MEVYPATRKGGRTIEKEQEEEAGREWSAGCRQAEESPFEPGALWYRLGSQGVLRQFVEEVCEIQREGRGG